MPIKIDVFKETQDEWCPNFKFDYDNSQNFVRLSLLELEPYQNDPKLYRVCVWGADDDGMEKDYDTLDEAYKIFAFLVAHKYIDKPVLKKMGFVRA